MGPHGTAWDGTGRDSVSGGLTATLIVDRGSVCVAETVLVPHRPPLVSPASRRPSCGISRPGERRWQAAAPYKHQHGLFVAAFKPGVT